MKYKVGSTGRVVVARFNDGEDILAGIERIARAETIRAAQVQVVGALRGARFVAGPAEDVIPPEPVWKEFEGGHEVVAHGTIFWQDDAPKVHLHGVFSRGESVKSGCLRELVHTFLIAEVMITEIVGIDAVRALDPESGMVLLKL